MNNSNTYNTKLSRISSQRHQFRDYFQERTNKFEDHIKSNFDGGQQFFKVQDAYYEKRQKETQNYTEYLKKQLQ